MISNTNSRLLNEFLSSNLLTFEWRSDWCGSNHHPNEQNGEPSLLKTNLENSLKQLGMIIKNRNVLNIRPLVKIDHFMISQSHCQTAGGFVIATAPVGFDIEESARVTDKVAARIKHLDEILPPNMSDLYWAAKEACYKCTVHFHQAQVISDYQIGSWKEIDRANQVFEFQLLNPSEFAIGSDQICVGVAWRVDKWAFAIALVQNLNIRST